MIYMNIELFLAGVGSLVIVRFIFRRISAMIAVRFRREFDRLSIPNRDFGNRLASSLSTLDSQFNKFKADQHHAEEHKR